MNNSVLDYTDCCSRLEKIASKRKIYGSESNMGLNKKDSKQGNSAENVFLKEVKSKSKKIPFICVSSANKSHHMGINLQTTLSMIKRFPGSNFDEQEYPGSSSGNIVASKKTSGTNVSQQFSEMQMCPARCGNRYFVTRDVEEEEEEGEDEEDYCCDDDQCFDGTDHNPWAVRQTDSANVLECDDQKNSCSCSSRTMENYCKVMTPFVKNVRRRSNKSLETVQNPYTKAKQVKYYELLAERLLMLKSSTIAMNNEFFQLTEKYNKLYEQHVRNQNNNLTAILLQTEDELNALKSKVEETVNVYKDAVLAIARQQSVSTAAANAAAALANGGGAAGEDVRPRETTGVRLSRVLRRVQFLQEKLKTAHIVHGPADQTAAAAD